MDKQKQYKIELLKTNPGLIAEEILSRKRRGFSDAEIANQLGVTKNYVISVVKKNDSN